MTKHNAPQCRCTSFLHDMRVTSETQTHMRTYACTDSRMAWQFKRVHGHSHRSSIKCTLAQMSVFLCGRVRFALSFKTWHSNDCVSNKVLHLTRLMTSPRFPHAPVFVCADPAYWNTSDPSARGWVTSISAIWPSLAGPWCDKTKACCSLDALANAHCT